MLQLTFDVRTDVLQDKIELLFLRSKVGIVLFRVGGAIVLNDSLEFTTFDLFCMYVAPSGDIFGSAFLSEGASE